jgi:hypothetical protein
VTGGDKRVCVWGGGKGAPTSEHEPLPSLSFFPLSLLYLSLGLDPHVGVAGALGRDVGGLRRRQGKAVLQPVRQDRWWAVREGNCFFK